MHFKNDQNSRYLPHATAKHVQSLPLGLSLSTVFAAKRISSRLALGLVVWLMLLCSPVFAQERLTEWQTKFERQLSLGRLGEAELTARIVQRQCDRLRPGDPRVGRGIADRCWLAMQCNQLARLEISLKKLEDLWTKVVATDERYHEREIFRAWVLWAKGDAFKAEKLFRAALDWFQKSCGRSDWKTTRIWRLLGQIAEQRGKLLRAANYYQNGLVTDAKLGHLLVFDDTPRLFLDFYAWDLFDKEIASYEATFLKLAAELKASEKTLSTEQLAKLRIALLAAEVRYLYWSQMKSLRLGLKVNTRVLTRLLVRVKLFEGKSASNSGLIQLLIAAGKLKQGLTGAATVELEAAKKVLSGTIGTDHPAAYLFRLCRTELLVSKGEWLLANTRVLDLERDVARFKHPQTTRELARSWLLLTHADWAQANFKRMGRRLIASRELLGGKQKRYPWRDGWRIEFGLAQVRLLRLTGDLKNAQKLIKSVEQILAEMKLQRTDLAIRLEFEQLLLGNALGHKSMTRSRYRKLAKSLVDYSETHPIRLEILTLSAFVFAEGADHEFSERILASLLPTLKRHYDDYHWTIAVAEVAQGLVHLRNRKHDRAKYFMLLGMKKLSKKLTAAHPLYMKGLIEFSDVRDHSSDRAGAVKMLEAELKILDKEHGKDSLIPEPLLNKLLWFYRRTGAGEAAAVVKKRLEKIEATRKPDEPQENK